MQCVSTGDVTVNPDTEQRTRNVVCDIAMRTLHTHVT